MNKAQKNQRLKIWLKRIGIGGFLFFLIKGLIWVAVGIYIWFRQSGK